MDIKLGHAHVSLGHGEVVRIARARGALLRGIEGVLWVTQAADQEDYVLQPGQRLRIAGDGPVVVHALRASAFAVDTATENASTARSRWSTLRRAAVELT